MSHLHHPHHYRSWPRLLAMLALLLTTFSVHVPRTLAAPPAKPLLEFTGGDGGIADSGFDAILPGTKPADTSKLTLAPGAPGTLTIRSTLGDLPPNGADQDNALATSYVSQGSYTIGARLLAPLTFSSTYQAAGIFIGKDASNYVRFTAGIGSKRSNAQRLQLDVMDRGKLRSSTILLPAGTFGAIDQSLDLFLNVEHNGSKITALYRINSDDQFSGSLATTRNFPRWLRGGGNTVYTGLVTTSRGAPTAATFVFDWFRWTQAPQITPSVVGTKTVNKDGLSSPVNPGDILTYTINVQNNGSGSTNAQVVDPIPVDTTYVSGSATASAGTLTFPNNQVTWTGSLAGNGGTATISFQVRINQAPLQSSTIQNTATMTSGSSAFPALLSASTLVSGAPDLSGSSYSADPTTVGLNGLVTYTLALQNDGPGTATNAAAQLTVPDRTTYVQGSAKASRGQITIDPTLSLLTWSADGPLPADGTATISFTVRASGTFLNNEPIASQAIVQADGALPSVATAQALFVDAASIGTVSGTKVVDKAQANIGDTLTYTITVSNNSNAAATNLQVVDPIPQDASFVNGSLSIPAVGTATYEGANRRVNWQIPSLASGQAVTISLKTTINSLLHSSVILNKAVLTNPSANVSQTLLATSTVVQNVADLSDSTYTATPAAVGANGKVTYTLTLLSDGTAAASGANAHLTIPALAGVALVPNSAKASSGSISQSGDQLIWSAGGSLPIGAVVSISFQVQISAPLANGTPIPSTATVQATGTLSTILTTKATYNTAVQAPRYLLYIPVVFR